MFKSNFRKLFGQSSGDGFNPVCLKRALRQLKNTVAVTGDVCLGKAALLALRAARAVAGLELVAPRAKK